MSALLDGVYDGEMTIGELLTHGDFGLGRSTRSTVSCSCSTGGPPAARRRRGASARSGDPHAVRRDHGVRAAHQPRRDGTRTTAAEFADLLIVARAVAELPVRGAGERAVRGRSAPEPSPGRSGPIRPLVEVTKGEPVQEVRDVDGVVAGFRTPLYERGIGVPGGHVHFIDDDRTGAAATCSTSSSSGRPSRSASAATSTSRLPMTPEFAHAHLDPADLEGQIERTERHT